MVRLNNIYQAIAATGFSKPTLELINKYVNDILNGRADFYRFNQPEHAGLCKAGSALIGASIIADYATASFRTGSDVESCQGGSSNWEIDERQEQHIESWAKAAQLWVENASQILTDTFGPMIAQGAEAKVYYREGDPSVIKERVSIYSTTQKALDAIVIHNYLFPETAMHVIGYTRDSDGLLRIILTQPYIKCIGLASKEDIDELVFAKGFRDNHDGRGINYISDRLILEDMHPANVFIDEISHKATCIDCIVKFIG